MRVTSNISQDALLQRIQRLGTRQLDLQTEASSGQKLRTADQDSAAMHRVLSLQSEAQSAAQYQENIARHKDRASVTFSALNSLKKVLDRAREIVVLSDGLTSPEEMKTYAAEVRQLLEQTVQIANSKHGEEFLFAGTRSLAQPFTFERAPDGSIASVSFQGSSSLPESEIAPGQLATSHIAGANTTPGANRGLLQDSRFGADFFGHLIQLQQRLEAGDSAGVMAQTAGLKADEENFLFHIAANGALQSRLAASDNQAQAVITGAEQGTSREADADLAQTLMELNQNQVAYQIALQSSAKSMELTLLDFIR